MQSDDVEGETGNGGFNQGGTSFALQGVVAIGGSRDQVTPKQLGLGIGPILSEHHEDGLYALHGLKIQRTGSDGEPDRSLAIEGLGPFCVLGRKGRVALDGVTVESGTIVPLVQRIAVGKEIRRGIGVHVVTVLPQAQAIDRLLDVLRRGSLRRNGHADQDLSCFRLRARRVLRNLPF